MIINFEELPSIRQKHRDQQIVFRGGCFDIFHEGHVAGLDFAKKLGEILVVGVRPNDRVTERKGQTRPVRDEKSRALVVDAVRYVDYTFIMPPGDNKIGAASLRVVDALRPDIFVGVGSHVGSHPNDSMVEALGARIVLDHNVPSASSTEIINHIVALHRNQQ
jgi:D-beta-D-heptose 7-phosphate kinase/D-beta-D-heptose 1-phosphate adenosyltransferase